MEFCVKQHIEVIPQETRLLISARYKKVTSVVNREFRNIQSETANSFYVGSYGRGTAISTSDIDIILVLPREEYERTCKYSGNQQSRLLQVVRSAILSSYPKSDIRADGQVVKINFSDGMMFELLPAFETYNGNVLQYVYPDSNMGGNWRSTNPRAEQDAMKQKNVKSNGLLYDTCKHMRRIRNQNFSSYHLSGIVIDSFVYDAMRDWHWVQEGEVSRNGVGDYENVLMEYFIRHCHKENNALVAPGSKNLVELKPSYDCLEKVLKKMCA